MVAVHTLKLYANVRLCSPGHTHFYVKKSHCYLVIRKEIKAQKIIIISKERMLKANPQLLSPLPENSDSQTLKKGPLQLQILYESPLYMYVAIDRSYI